MKRIPYVVIIGLAIASASNAIAQSKNSPLKLVQTIAMPDVEGRIDHMAVDVKGKRLFVAALGNNTLEVIDLAAGKRIHSIRGLKEPQGVGYVPQANRILVANGQGEGCDVFDGASYKLLAGVKLGDDSDNIRFVAPENGVYVGYGNGAIAAFASGAENNVRKCSLSAHPESFQCEKGDSRIFVNVPNARQIEVVDRKSMKVAAKWPVTSAQANFPMSLDEKNQRVFIGCRKPPKMLIYDTQTGKQVAEIGIAGDTDDLFYDAARKRIYITCGEGWIDVIEQKNANDYALVGHEKTVPGARTSLFVPELNRLYVACRKTGGNPAEIRVYEVDSRQSNRGDTDLSAVVLQNYGFHFLLP